MELRKGPSSGKMAQQVQEKQVLKNIVKIDCISSIAFATVLETKLYWPICPDNGADCNVMDNRTFRAIDGTGADIEVQKLNRPRMFEMAPATPDGRRTTLTCTKTACINMEIKIRHGSALVLRNLRWLISEQPLSDPLLGRPLLKALGPNTRRLLAAAPNRFAGSIDAKRFVGRFAEKGDSRVS